jgi:hypothetical protein
MRKLSMKGNKKGLADVIIVMLIFFTIAISMLVMVMISNSLRSGMTPQLSALDNRSGTAFDNTLKVIPDMADTIFMIVLIGLIIGILITSFLFWSHPVFMILWIILSLGAMVLSVILGNIYETIATNPIFNTTITSIPMTQQVMTHFPLLMLGIIVISMIVIYAKSQQRNMGGNI